MRWRVVCALLRGDADLLPHQRVEQRALAHVGAADDGDQAAALRARQRAARRPAPESGGHLHRRLARGDHDRSGPPGRSLALSCSSRRRAASCSAARRERPSPCSARPQRGTRTPPRRSGRGPGRAWRRCGRSAPRCGAPAAIPAVRSWRPCSSLSTSVPGSLAEQARTRAAAPPKPPSMEDRADERFHGVGQDGRPLRAAATQPRLRTGAAPRAGPAQRHAVQAVLAHQVRAHAGQVALRRSRRSARQQAGHRQAQHGIAQEFQPLVVVGAEAAVRQRTLQQARLAKRWPRRCCRAASVASMGISVPRRLAAGYLDAPRT
jgi:hypothetical protein